MRFYNSDGSVRSEDGRDVDFGWSFDLVVEEEGKAKIKTEDGGVVSAQNKRSPGEKEKEEEERGENKSEHQGDESKTMRFYNSDESVRSKDADANFGWTLDWAVTGSKTFDGDDEVFVSEQGKKRGDEEEDNEKEEEEEDNKNNRKLDQSNYDVAKDYSQYNLEMKHKEDLTDFLMRMDNAESLLLVSIVNNGLYKILGDSQEATAALKDNPRDQRDLDLALRLNRRERLQKLRSVFGKVERESSLLAELSRCDLVMGLEEFRARPGPAPSNMGEDEGVERRGGFERIGLNGDIDKTLGDFFDKTCRAHIEVGRIGKCFREIDDKISEVGKKASEFRRDVHETKFLNDVLHLLEGNFEKVEGDLPFKNVGKNAANRPEANLII